MPPCIGDIDKMIDAGVDGFIFGIKDFSLFFNFQMTMDELKDILPSIKNKKKEVFIALNKIIYNEDISLLKEYLLILDNLNIDGILYDDISIVNLKKELGLKTDLVWHQAHLVTNYQACNYWHNRHEIKYGFLSNEITLEDILEIKKNTSMQLMMLVYGYLPMFQSSRSLITNYLSYIDKKKQDNLYYLNEPIKKMECPIYEDINGTYILSSHILNALSEIPTLIDAKMDYLVLNGLCLSSDEFIRIADIFVKASLNSADKVLIEALNKDANDISKSTDKGFLYKETVYRVKSNE